MVEHPANVFGSHLRVGFGHLTLAGQHALQARDLFLQFSGVALGAGELIADLRETAVRGGQPLLLQLQASERQLHARGGGGHLFYRGAETAHLREERRQDVSAVRRRRASAPVLLSSQRPAPLPPFPLIDVS